MIVNKSAGLKTRLLLLFLPFLLISVTPSSADACQCNRRKPPCEAFPLASTVFIGRVIDSAERKTETDSDGNERTYNVGIIRFEIEEVFKGTESRIVEIHSGTRGKGKVNKANFHSARYKVGATSGSERGFRKDLSMEPRSLPLVALTRRSSAEVEIFSKHINSVRHMKMSGQASSGGSVRGPDGCGLDLESA